MHKVAIGDREMEYLHFGKEGAEKLVVLPGLSLKSVIALEGVIVAGYSLLAKNYDIYLFDHVRQEPEGYRIEEMAEDTLSALDELGCSRVHLMGISLGGMVAQMLAIKAPGKVASLILCSTAMGPKGDAAAVLAQWKELAKAKNAEGLMDSFGEYVYTPSFYERFRNVIRSLGDGATDSDFKNFLISLDAVERFDSEDEIPGISCPVLVLAADEDRIFSIQATQDLIDALQCESFIFKGYGHAVYDEAPGFLARVESFLRENVQENGS